MNLLSSWWSKLISVRREKSIDRFHVKVVTTAAELAIAEDLPMELRYVMAVRPSRFETFRELLDRGYGIGVRMVDKTPERVLLAVDRISRETQENTILPWLERFLRHEELPVWTADELEHAEKAGLNLYEEIRVIRDQRFEFVKIVLVDLHNRGVTDEEQTLMHDVNLDLFPLAIDTITHRVTFDNAHTRTEIAQSLIKAMIVIGPLAHVLEHVLSGLGKVFAASSDDLLSEAAELFALRGSGFTWRQLGSRFWMLGAVFVLATFGAFQVEPLIESGHVMLAGIVFGLSAVSLSLTTAIQSIGLYQRSYHRLAQAGKIALQPGQSLLGLALRQDFTNPTRIGLFLGAAVSPLLAGLVFLTQPLLASNGWILALLGSTESIVAGCAVLSATRIERLFFRAKVSTAMRNILQGTHLDKTQKVR